MLAFHKLGTHFDMDCGHTKKFRALGIVHLLHPLEQIQ